MYIPIQSNKIFEQIAQQIEKRILSGELQSGDRLPTERELSQQFHASRTAVREAMKTLAQRGLVDMRPGRGTIVIDGTSQAMRHSMGLMMKVGQAGSSENLVELREIIEPEIAALAAVRATNEQIAGMRKAVEVMDTHIHEADAYIAADNDFHRSLATGTQSILIHTVIDYNRTKSKAEWLLDAGMQRADSPRAVAESADVVFTMVTNTNALHEVLRGPDGVLDGLGQGKIYIDMSTVSPNASRKLAE